MEIDSYAHLSSPVHAWDPRFKLASGFVLILVCASLTAARALAAGAGGALVLVLRSRLPPRFLWRLLRAPLLLAALMFPLLLATAGGRPLWSWGFLHLYRDGLTAAIRIAVKAFTIVLLFACFFGTVKLHRALKALEYLKVPSTLLVILLFTYRYIYLYLEYMGKLLIAARLRGYSLRRGLRHAGATSAVLVTLLIRSYEQSERVAAAMRLRGFDGSFPTLEGFHSRRGDLLASLLVAAWIGVLLWLELR
jgi:cobalt/nickel transport system permease protein